MDNLWALILPSPCGLRKVWRGWTVHPGPCILDHASWTVHPGLCFASQHISPLCHFSSFMSLCLYLGPNTPSKHPGTGTKYTVLGRHVRDTFYTEYKCTLPLPRNSKQPFVIWLRAGRGANNGNPRPYLVSSSSFSHPPLFLPLLLPFFPSFWKGSHISQTWFELTW